LIYLLLKIKAEYTAVDNVHTLSCVYIVHLYLQDDRYKHIVNNSCIVC